MWEWKKNIFFAKSMDLIVLSQITINFPKMILIIIKKKKYEENEEKLLDKNVQLSNTGFHSFYLMRAFHLSLLCKLNTKW